MDFEKQYIQALDLEKQGDWDQAHRIIQEIDTITAAWLHAYLHRKERDSWNANYWYQRAGKPFFEGSLDDEWLILWEHFNA